MCKHTRAHAHTSTHAPTPTHTLTPTHTNIADTSWHAKCVHKWQARYVWRMISTLKECKFRTLVMRTSGRIWLFCYTTEKRPCNHLFNKILNLPWNPALTRGPHDQSAKFAFLSGGLEIVSCKKVVTVTGDEPWGLRGFAPSNVNEFGTFGDE